MILITTTARREAFAQEAYEQGCEVTEAEYQATLDDKEIFIEEQAGLTQQLINVPGLIDWGKLPRELALKLADYV